MLVGPLLTLFSNRPADPTFRLDLSNIIFIVISASLNSLRIFSGYF